MLLKRTSSYLLYILSLVLLFPIVTFAQRGGGPGPGGGGGGSGPSGGFSNPLGNTTLVGFLEQVLDALVIILFPIIVLFFIYAAFLFLTAQGNEEKLSSAKRMFLWTVIGALLVLGAWTLAQAIKGTVDEIRGVTTTESHISQN